MAHTCNHSVVEIEAGGLATKIKASLKDRPCLKMKQKYNPHFSSAPTTYIFI